MARGGGSAALIIQSSFSAGEVSPTLFGRVDLSKYKIGLASMQNWFVDYRGGASTRAGTRYTALARVSAKPVRVIRFQFSVVQEYVLEFGDYYMRVIKDGGLVLEPSKALAGATQSNPGVFTVPSHGWAVGDWIQFDSVGGMTQINNNVYIISAVTTNTFSITSIYGVPVDTSGFGGYTSGGNVSRIYVLTTPYAAEDLALLKFTQSKDVLTLTHPNYIPRNLNRYQHYSWTITPIQITATVQSPVGLSGSSSTAGSTSYLYAVTAVSDSNEESIASDPIVISSAADMSATAGSNSLQWTPTGGAQYYNIYRSTQVYGAGANVPLGTFVGYVGRSFAADFKDSNIVPDFTKSPPLHNNPFVNGGITSLVITNPGTGYSVTGTTITATDPSGMGFKAQVLVNANGNVDGFVIQDTGSGYVSPTFMFGGGGTGAAVQSTVSALTNNNPGSVGYFQQRKVYAGSNNFPETVWGSKVVNFNNFDISFPTSPSDSFEFSLASQQVNNIKFMQTMPGGLLLFTGGSIWQLSGGGTNTALTATNATANPQIYVGVADVPPIVIGSDVLYVTLSGTSVRDLVYNAVANIYNSDDKSILANHLFEQYGIKEWIYAEEPFRIIWAVREDGMLLSFTYLKDQEVYGWARHITAGTFESITSIHENRRDVIYTVVRRTVLGQQWRFIERMDERNFTSPTDAWCVDCGLDLKTTTPVTVIGGLGHLEGQTVAILVDGGVQTPQVVVNAQITLAHSATQRVIIGLGYECVLQTLPLDVGEPTIQGKRKTIKAVSVKINAGRGLEVGRSLTDMIEIKERGSQPYGVALPLFAGNERVLIPQQFDTYGQFYVRQRNPIPATLLAAIPEVVIGDS